MSEKRIEKCPVCGSDKIEQIITTHFLTGDTAMIDGDGSWCTSCGVKFAFDTTHLEQDIEKEKASWKRAVATARQNNCKEQATK